VFHRGRQRVADFFVAIKRNGAKVVSYLIRGFATRYLVVGIWYLEEQHPPGLKAGCLRFGVATLCRCLQLRDGTGRDGTYWDEHRGRGGVGAQSALKIG